MTTAIIVICAALLIIFAVWRTIQRFRGKARSSCCGSAEMVTAKKVEDTDESHYPHRYVLQIPDMVCSNCARNVENTLNGIDGIWARVDLGHKTADVLAKKDMKESDFSAALSGTSYRLAGYRRIV